MITLPMMRWEAMVSNRAEAWHQWPPPRANAVMTFPKLAMSGTGPCWSLRKPLLVRISVILLQKMMTMICDFEILWHMQNFTCWVHPIEYKHIIHHDLDSWSHCPWLIQVPRLRFLHRQATFRVARPVVSSKDSWKSRLEECCCKKTYPAKVLVTPMKTAVSERDGSTLSGNSLRKCQHPDWF